MVCDDLLMTCAHVVNAMLGRGEGEKGEPDQRVSVLADGDAEVVAWYAPVEPDEVRRPDTPHDVALLRLIQTPVPRPVVELVDEPPADGVRLGCFGFPGSYPNGLGGAAVAGEADTGGWQQLRHDGDERLFVEPGFSGAPLLDPQGRVVGMVVQDDPGRRIAHMIPVVSLWRAWPVLARPYLGLQSFTEANRRFFAGREYAITRVLEKLADHPLVTLVGPSGSGKSSVVGAGVLPRLREAGRVILKTRPLKDPVDSLRKTLSDALTSAGLSRPAKDVRQALRGDGRRGLLDLCEDLAQGRKVLLFIDQFEEVFASAVGEDERRAYLDLLTPGEHEEVGPLHILLTVRSEFQNAMLSRDGFNEPVEQGLCPLRTMKPKEIGQAVTAPAGEVGVTVEPALLDRIQREIRPDGTDQPLPGFLPLLSFAMNQLWSQAGQRELILADWQAGLGGLSGALGNHAEAAFAGLPETDQQIAESLFDLLVEARDDGTTTRLTVLRDSLTDGQRRVVGIFTDARLLTTDLDAEDRATVEIAHETLMQHWERLKQQIEAQRRFLLWRSQIRSRMADWQARDQDPGSLLSGGALEEAEDYAQLNVLEVDLRDFITHSRATENARGIWDLLLVENTWRGAAIELASSDLATRTAFARETFAQQARIGLAIGNDSRRREDFRFVVRALVATDVDIRSKIIDHAHSFTSQRAGVPELKIAFGLFSAELDYFQPELLQSALLLAKDPDQCRRIRHAIARGMQPIDEDARAKIVQYFAEKISYATSVGQIAAFGQAISFNVEAISPRIASYLVFKFLDVLYQELDLDHSRSIGKSITSLLYRLNNEELEKSIQNLIMIMNNTSDKYKCFVTSNVISSSVNYLDSNFVLRVARSIIEIIIKTDNQHKCAAFGDVLASLVGSLPDDRVSILIIEIKMAFSRTINPYGIAALGMAMAKKVEIAAPNLLEFTTQCLVNALIHVNFSDQGEVLSQPLSTMLPKIESNLKEDIAFFLADAIHETRSSGQCAALGEVLASGASDSNVDAVVGAVRRLTAILIATGGTNQCLKLGRSLWSLVGSIAAAAAVEEVVHDLLAAMKRARDSSQLVALGQAIAAGAYVLSPSTIENVIQTLASSIDKQKHIDEPAVLGTTFAVLIRALPNESSVGIVRSLAKTLQSNECPSQCLVLGHAIAADVDSLPSDVAASAVIQLEAALRGTEDLDLRAALGQTIAVSVSALTSEAAYATLPHLVSALRETRSVDQCAALGQALAALTHRLPEPEAVEVILSALRWPFTVGEATEHLLDAARTRFVPDLAPDAGYWDFVTFVGRRFPGIDLRVPD